jgi:DNA-binding FadR family transcriptional regulator
MRNDLKSKTPAKRRSPVSEAKDGTLTDRAYRELEEMIVTLQLSPGTVLSEQALAVRLKIGRTPIREALQRLARDGLAGRPGGSHCFLFPTCAGARSHPVRRGVPRIFHDLRDVAVSRSQA